MSLIALPRTDTAGGVIVATPAAPAAPAALGNNTTYAYTLSDAKTTAQADRLTRYLLRDELITLSGIRQTVYTDEVFAGTIDNFPGRVAMCGRRRIDKTTPVTAKIKDGVAHLSGLQLCGSVWACPVCQAKIRQERTADLQAGLENHFRVTDCQPNENRGALITLTVQHHNGMRLADTLKAVADSFRAIISTPTYAGRKRTRVFTLPRDNGKLHELRTALAATDAQILTEEPWIQVKVLKDGTERHTDKLKVTWLEPGERQLLDLLGTIRAVEVTVGGNGWHPHAHVLAVSSRHLRVDELAALKAAWFGRWRTEVRKRGLDANERAGVDVKPLNAANMGTYLTKAQDRGNLRSLAYELTRPDLKKGRRKGRTPFQVLQDAVDAAKLDVDAGLMHALDAQHRPLTAGQQVDACDNPTCRHTVCKDAALWREYEKATRGHRALTWTPGLRDALLLDAEKTDDEIANAEVEEAVVVLVFDELDWRVLCAVKGARASLLNLLENTPAEDRTSVGYAWLDELLADHPDLVDRYRVAAERATAHLSDNNPKD